MKNNLKSKKNKKGFLALETLLGLIISVIALFFIFQVFYSTFFNMNLGNEKISNDNLKSFQNFIRYNYNDKNTDFNCFNILKLKNLINYQFPEEKIENNFLYILNKNGIYSIKIKNYEKILESKNFKKYIFKSECFSSNSIFSKNCDNFNNFNLYLDETSQGWNFLGSNILSSSVNGAFFDLSSFGNLKDKLKIKQMSKDSFYLFKPKFSKYDKQNDFDVLFIDKNLDNKVFGNYLVLDKSNKKLFISAGTVSEILINRNLCFLNNLNKKDLQNYYSNNPLKINSIENNVFFSWNNENNVDVINFEWKNAPFCKNNNLIINCKSLDKNLFNNLKNIKYNNFVDLIYTYYNKYSSLIGVSALKISIKPLNFKDIPKNKFLDFSILFKKTDLNSKNMINKNNNKIYSFSGWSDNVDLFNNCNLDFCKKLFLINNEAYFYIYNKKGFYKFDYRVLKKKIDQYNNNNYKLFYLGKYYDVQELKKLDLIGTGFLGFFTDTQNFYLIKKLSFGKNGKDKIDVILSTLQFEQIPILGGKLK